MGTSPKCLHLNVNRSYAVTEKLGKTILSLGTDVISLNEPHICEGSIAGRPNGYSEVFSPEDRGRAALWVSPRLKYCVVRNTRDIVAIRCTISGEEVLTVSCYCSPSEDIVPILIQISGLIDEFPDFNIQVVGDLMRSLLSGPTDPRGEVISFAMAHDLEIMNKPDSVATLDGHQGQS